jgi:hypothetical protein
MVDISGSNHANETGQVSIGGALYGDGVKKRISPSDEALGVAHLGKEWGMKVNAFVVGCSMLYPIRCRKPDAWIFTRCGVMELRSSLPEAENMDCSARETHKVERGEKAYMLSVSGTIIWHADRIFDVNCLCGSRSQRSRCWTHFGAAYLGIEWGGMESAG